MAVTIDQFINGSVPFDAVLNQIKKHFALQFKARNLYVDDERTRGSILSLFVDEKNYKPRIDVQDELLDEACLDIIYTTAPKALIDKSLVGYKTVLDVYVILDRWMAEQ